jgi:hypothetical protein
LPDDALNNDILGHLMSQPVEQQQGSDVTCGHCLIADSADAQEVENGQFLLRYHVNIYGHAVAAALEQLGSSRWSLSGAARGRTAIANAPAAGEDANA